MKRKFLPFAMVLAVLAAVLVAPITMGVLADQEEPIFENMPIIEDGEDIAPLSLENDILPLASPAPGDLVDGRVALNINEGAVVITPEGATVNGVAVGTGLNDDGYYIYSETGTDTAIGNTVTVQCTAESGFAAALPIVLQDGLKLTCETAPINIGSYANVELTLNNNALQATGGSKYHGTYAGIRITKNSTVAIENNGESSVVSQSSAGILLCDGAELTLSAGQADDTLSVTGNLSKSYCSAIGTSYTSTGKNIDTGDDLPFAKLQIDSGRVIAKTRANKGLPVIGSACTAVNSGVGQIIINGGYVEAIAGVGTLPASIACSLSDDSVPIQINGGSVNGKLKSDIQHKNKNGQVLSAVVVTATDESNAPVANAVFKIGTWETVSDENGKLYLYLPVSAVDTVNATAGGVEYAGVIAGNSTDGYTVDMKPDSEACTCEQATVSCILTGQDVLVYTFEGVARVPLAVEFTPAEDCAKSHSKTVTYALEGSVADDEAKIDGDELLVYPKADGKTLRVVATVSVNGKTFTADAAEFTVSKSDDYVLDIAKGTITIKEDALVVGTQTYERDNTKSIKIIQSVSGEISNHIIVEDNAQIILDNINLKKKAGITTSEEMQLRYYALLHIDSAVSVGMTLVGENKISTDVGTINLGSYDQPPIYVNAISDLTINGVGSLWLKSGGSAPAIGANVVGKYGDIVINGGRIVALGGQGNGGSGAPGVGTLGDVDKKNDGNVTVNGGLLIAAKGANTDSMPRDIKANMVINGGSVATCDTDGKTAADICFYEGSVYPKNSAGENVYRVVLTVEGAPANKPVSYTVDEGAVKQTYTDESGKLYLYLPAETDYQQLIATVDGVEYYKRLRVSANNDNAAVMVKEPKVTVTEFGIPGQIGDTVIDNELHTIKLTVQAGVDISHIVPSVEAGGAEYRPEGGLSSDTPQDFSEGKLVKYLFCNDKGDVVTYSVTVEQAALAPGEKTVLNVGNGDIKMTVKSGQVVLTEGGASILPNSNGYIITGESSTAIVDLKGLTVPIVLRNLNITSNGSGAAVNLYATSADNIDITLDGVNTIKTPNGGTALYLWASSDIDFVLNGCGILQLESNGSCVYAPDNIGFTVEDGASLFTSLGVDTKQVTNAAGERMCPIEVTVTHKDAENATVYYQDRVYTETAMGTKVKYLTNGTKKLTVYRPAGTYNMAVTVGDDEENICRGNVVVDNNAFLNGIARVTLGVPKVTKLENLMPESALGSDKWKIKVSGNEYLGGEIKVTATGDKGEKISAVAVQTAVREWIAELNIPNNTEGKQYKYKLSVTVDGKEQKSVTADTITMLSELAIKTCELNDTKYQIGRAVIDSDNKTIDFTVPYDLDFATTPIQLKMTPTNAYYEPANFATSYDPFYVDDADGDGKYTFVQKIANNSVWSDADVVSYDVTLTKQPTPKVTGLEIASAVTYRGGKVYIKLSGENFGSLLNALHNQPNDTVRADRVEIKVGNDTVTYKPTQTNIADNNFVAEVNALPNFVDETGMDPDAGMVSMYHPIEVYVNGVQQTIATFKDVNDTEASVVQLTVPGQMEMNATISALAFGDKLTYTEAETSEIKRKYGYAFDEAKIESNGEGAVGEILVYIPWQTDLATLGNPTVTTRNPNATVALSARTAEGTGFTQTITVTPVKGAAKDYKLTVTRVATEAELDVQVKSLVYPAAQIAYTDPAKAEADNAEIKAKYGYGFNEAQINHTAGTIEVLMPWGTDLTALVPNVGKAHALTEHEVTDVSKTPTDKPVSIEQKVKVTSVTEDIKEYKLTVTRVATEAEKDVEVKSLVYPADQIVYTDSDKAEADNAEIKAKYGYGFNEAQINHTAGTIDVLMPWGTDLTALVPNVGKAHIGTLHTESTVSQEPVDAEKPVSVVHKLTITAVDGTDKDYKLTVTRVATEAEKDPTIHAISLEGMTKSEIATAPDKDGKYVIKVIVKRGIKTEALTPILELAHKETKYTPEGEQNFKESSRNPIVYTVTAVDGTQMEYYVTIVQQNKSGNKLTLVQEEGAQDMPAYINGKEDGNFHPDDVLTRSEASAMLARVHEKFDKSKSYSANYADVTNGAWYKDYVGFLSEQGVLQGNEKGEFMPESKVSRMEFAAMLARLAGFPIDKDAVAKFADIKGTWGESEIMALLENGVVNGYEDGTFRPHNKLSRAEAVAMVNRLMKRGTTKEEIAALQQVSNPFNDVDESHWAYSDIISAVTDYSVYIKSETLGTIHDEWVTVTLPDKAE